MTTATITIKCSFSFQCDKCNRNGDKEIEFSSKVINLYFGCDECKTVIIWMRDKGCWDKMYPDETQIRIYKFIVQSIT